MITFGLRKFREAGMKMWYSGSSAPNEEIRMTGKTTEALKVYVSPLCAGSLHDRTIRMNLKGVEDDNGDDGEGDGVEMVVI